MRGLKTSLVFLGAVATGHSFVPSPGAGLPTRTFPSLERLSTSSSAARQANSNRRIGSTGAGKRVYNRASGVLMATSSARRTGGGGDEAEGPDELKARAAKNMLSESSVASVVYYWLEFRDDLTPQWMKQFTYRNGDILDIGWNQHIELLLRAEPEEMVVRRLSQRPQGGSGNNPYLKPNRTQMEYTVLIEPQSIARKIMRVREQIATEWIQDLGLISAENSEVERHREDSLCLDVESKQSNRKLVFDHDPLNNTSSPYRGKNYALLLGMITKAAVRAYRSELRISGDRYTLNWLEKFIHKNDMEGGPNLKGNELVEAILDGPIVVIKDPRTDKNRVIDPGHIGKQLMMFRQQEAQVVMKAMESVPGDHTALNRQFLEERMRDQLEEVVLTQRRQRIVEASAPTDDFPTAADAGMPQEGFEI
ncbi:unnamed protein product [Pylaiella littoralis]